MPRIGIGLGNNIVERFGSFDADYQAVLNYAISIGATLPSAGQQTKQNQLLVDLKSAGIWSRLDTFAMFATDGSSSFALIDWKRLVTYTNNSSTFSTNGGFTTNGTNGFINTNFNPFTGTFNYVRDNASRSFWVDNRTVATYFEGLTNANANATYNGSALDQLINQGVTNLNALTDMGSDGFKSINRTSSTAVEIFNNTSQLSRTANSAALANSSQVLGRKNLLYGSHRFRFYSMGSNLVSQNTNYRNAINNYLTSL